MGEMAIVEEFSLADKMLCVAGHFDGAPIAPGAWLLSKVDLLIRKHLPDYQLLGFNKVKFLAPLVPNQVCMIRILPGAKQRWQVTLCVEQTIILEATVNLVSRSI